MNFDKVFDKVCHVKENPLNWITEFLGTMTQQVITKGEMSTSIIPVICDTPWGTVLCVLSFPFPFCFRSSYTTWQKQFNDRFLVYGTYPHRIVITNVIAFFM